MRLMLGVNGRPELLVSVDSNYDPKHFEFDVINGAWEGRFENGKMFVTQYDIESKDPVGNIEILCDNGNRLRGDYNDVFNNFDNPDYVAPVDKYEKPEWDDLDDDIPF